MSMKDGIAIADSLEGGDVFGVRIYDALTGKNPVHTSTTARESQTKMNRHTRLCHRAIGVRSRAARSMTILQRPLPCGPMTSKTENWAGRTIFTEGHRGSALKRQLHLCFRICGLYGGLCKEGLPSQLWHTTLRAAGGPWVDLHELSR